MKLPNHKNREGRSVKALHDNSSLSASLSAHPENIYNELKRRTA